jgi:Flp pilus assembly protein TadB
MLLVVMVLSLFCLAGSALCFDLWWGSRRERRYQEQMQAMVDALDA